MHHSCATDDAPRFVVIQATMSQASPSSRSAAPSPALMQGFVSLFHRIAG
jgi:hypothetical protein